MELLGGTLLFGSGLYSVALPPLRLPLARNLSLPFVLRRVTLRRSDPSSPAPVASRTKRASPSSLFRLLSCPGAKTGERLGLEDEVGDVHASVPADAAQGGGRRQRQRRRRLAPRGSHVAAVSPVPSRSLLCDRDGDADSRYGSFAEASARLRSQIQVHLDLANAVYLRDKTDAAFE